MTAEIAILNKTAVALAADSAVTISAGSKEEKIYDSADKLFELCSSSHVGIMIYNNMSFADAPLSLLINRFRAKNTDFKTVEETANAFLSDLVTFARQAPLSVKENSVYSLLQPVVDHLQARYSRKVNQLIESMSNNRIGGEEITPETLRRHMSEAFKGVVEVYDRVISREPDCMFFGDIDTSEESLASTIIEALIASNFSNISDENANLTRRLMVKFITKAIFGNSVSGIVIAGFGQTELFPTLLSYEIDGIIDGIIRYSITNHVDVDRGGPRAKVIPFAQKEMVERFLYGVDESISVDIATFAENTVSKIRESILNSIDFADEADAETVGRSAMAAEDAFVNGLRNDAFAEIRKASQAEIEDMVEFMPKPELARMAEALVNLTSIKRRVSRGMETVGGPIDVAVISHSEGFVWVKRKRYFPSELNPRYYYRVEQSYRKDRERTDDQDAPPRSARKSGGKTRKPAVK